MTTRKAVLSPNPFFQFFDNAGVPLSGGLLYTYLAETSTPKATYPSSSMAALNANPIVLDASGRCSIYLDNVSYKFILKSGAGVTIKTMDNVGGSSTSALTVNTIADLRDLDAGISTFVTVLGYSSMGDGGGGSFYWNTASTESDDNGVIINPTSYTGTGRWMRILSGYVSPKMYGAWGDGVHDDSDAVIDCDTYAEANDIGVIIEAGTYLISRYNTATGFSSTFQFQAKAIVKWSAAINPEITVSITDSNQHFICSTASNAPVIKGVSEVIPEWFGAVVDGTTDDYLAIQQAINSCVEGMVVLLTSSKIYLTKTKVTIKTGVAIHSCSSRKSTIKADTTLTTTILELTVGYCMVENIGLDGNSVAKGIDLAGSSSLVSNCLIENAANGINLKGDYNRIDGNVFNECGVAINSANSSAVLNTITSNEIIDCYYGIQATTIDGDTISGNFTRFKDRVGVGVNITLSTDQMADIKNNKFYNNDSTGCTAIKTTNSGGIFGGHIQDNWIIGFDADKRYVLADTFDTDLRYEDDRLTTNAATIGDRSKIATTETASFVMCQPTPLGSGTNSKITLDAVGGSPDTDTAVQLFNRKMLVRTGTTQTWQGSKLHDSMGLNDSAITPGTDTKTWLERDPGAGSFRFGHENKEYATLNNAGLYLTERDLYVRNIFYTDHTLTGSIGVYYGGFSTLFKSSIDYNIHNDFVSLKIPNMAGEMVASHKGLYLACNDATTCSESHTVGTGTMTFILDDNITLVPGQMVNVITTATNPRDVGMITRVVSYAASTKTLVCASLATRGTGTFTSWIIEAASFHFGYHLGASTLGVCSFSTAGGASSDGNWSTNIEPGLESYFGGSLNDCTASVFYPLQQTARMYGRVLSYNNSTGGITLVITTDKAASASGAYLANVTISKSKYTYDADLDGGTTIIMPRNVVPAVVYNFATAHYPPKLGGATLLMDSIIFSANVESPGSGSGPITYLNTHNPSGAGVVSSGVFDSTGSPYVGCAEQTLTFKKN